MYQVLPTVGSQTMTKNAQESDPILYGVLSFSLSDNIQTFAALACKRFADVNILVPDVHVGRQKQSKRCVSVWISQEQSRGFSRVKINIMNSRLYKILFWNYL